MKCVDCGREMNPVEALLSEQSGRCRKCIDKKLLEILGPNLKNAEHVLMYGSGKEEKENERNPKVQS